MLRSTRSMASTGCCSLVLSWVMISINYRYVMSTIKLIKLLVMLANLTTSPPKKQSNASSNSHDIPWLKLHSRANQETPRFGHRHPWVSQLRGTRALRLARPGAGGATLSPWTQALCAAERQRGDWSHGTWRRYQILDLRHQKKMVESEEKNELRPILSSYSDLYLV